MGNFFDFLLALITFGWLRDRQGTVRNFDDALVMFGPKGQCESCDDGVYFDTRDIKWKHLSTRRPKDGHVARPVPFVPTPEQLAADRVNHLADLNRKIADLTASSERLALAAIPEDTALDAMDRINGQLAATILERDELQTEADLQVAAGLN